MLSRMSSGTKPSSLGASKPSPVEYARETPTRSLPLWLAALVVACGIVIGGVKVRSFMRSHLWGSPLRSR